MQKCLINTAEVLVPKYHRKQEHFQSVFPVFLNVIALRLCFLVIVRRESGALPRIIFPLDPFKKKKKSSLVPGRTRVA